MNNFLIKDINRRDNQGQVLYTVELNGTPALVAKLYQVCWDFVRSRIAPADTYRESHSEASITGAEFEAIAKKADDFDAGL